MFQTLTPNLMVEDVNATIKFYQDLLDFQVIASVPDEGELDFAIVTSGNITLLLQKRTSLVAEIPFFKDKPLGGSLTLYIQTTGIDELYQRISHQVTIVQDLHTTFYGTKEFAIEDCNQFILAFAEKIN
ncbi:MAG TPA: VOC family protein [Bacillota bacterium]|nr:VOC family protein [Bacillota bacterium]HOL08650.1 VOC family protein [Bacillota bacterium]HPO96648.1 VOC family protein [Bacillota bacterium]